MRPVARTFHAFGNPGVIAHDDDADGILLQVEGNAHDTIGELHQFLRLDIRQAGGAGNPIARLQHRADVGNAQLRLEGFDLLLQIIGNLFNKIGHLFSTRNVQEPGLHVVQ